MTLLERVKPLVQRSVTLAGLFTRSMTLGVRGLVLDPDGRILLVRHTYLPGWYLPGGGVEAGESMGRALARELREEGGVECIGTPRLYGIYLNRIVSRRDHVALFIVESFETVRPTPVPNAEIAAAEFFPWDGLPDDATPATRRRIAEVLRGADRSEDW